VESVTRELGQALSASRVSFLIADLSGRALVRLAQVRLDEPMGLAAGERRAAGESATVLPFDGGPAELTVRTQQVQVLEPGTEGGRSGVVGEWLVLAPVTERGETLGLLEMFLPEEPQPPAVAEISRLAHLLAFVVIANRRHTDLYEWGQRSRPLSLSAEIQRRLLPGPQVCEAGAFTLAAWLEPAAAIAGDTFDYNLARDLLHLSLTDAMGHGVAAALTATLCVSSLRNTRSQGGSLLEQATDANAVLVEHSAAAGLEDFVTGLLGRVDLTTGVVELVNAGHVPPYLCRGDQARALDLPANLPLGLFPEAAFASTQVPLQHGDRLVIVTDGMLERNAARLDLPSVISDTRSLHPREAVRALADRVLAASAGELSDDATVLCLDWHGGHGHDRVSARGADRGRPSPAL
jgi:serine phosphatase RsbU (regulator of sigma subunit)